MRFLDALPFHDFIRSLMEKGESTWVIAAHTHVPECPRFDAQEQINIGDPCIGCGGIERRTLMRMLRRPRIRDDIGDLLVIRLGSHPWFVWGIGDTRREFCICGCGAPLEQPPLQGRPRMYASDACRKRAYRARNLPQKPPKESLEIVALGGLEAP